MRLRRRTALAGAVVAVVALAALVECGGGPSGPHAWGVPCVTGDDARVAAQSVLDRRAAAVRDGDADAFLATVDPRAGDEMLSEQTMWFARVHQLPRREFTLEISVNHATGPDELTTYVNQGTWLRGIDAASVPVTHLMTFRHVDGCWLVVADQPDRLQIAQAPWDVPGSRVVRRDGVLLVTDETDDGERERILDAAADAWRTDRRVLAKQNDHPDDAGVVVLAFTTTDAMKANGYFHDNLDLTGGVELPIDGDSGAVDYRVLVAPVELGGDQASYLPEVLRHEFVHVLLARHPMAPVWATEGAAEFYSSGRAGGPMVPLSDLVPAGSRTGGVGLPHDQEFYAHDWASRSGNYAVAWAAMAYVAQEHGNDEPAELVRALNAARAYRPAVVERVLRERYGLSSAELGTRARALIAGLR